MKKNTILIIGLHLLSLMAFTQERKIITIKAGTRVGDVFAQHEIYRYPEFIQGKVSFKDGKSTVIKLNYSILEGEMQFVASGDTMAIANEKNVAFIQIMRDTFYYDNGYLEVLAGHGPVIMAVKQYVKISDIKKEGPYGARTSASSTQAYSGIYDQGTLRNYNLVVQEDLVLTKITSYYIGNTSKGFVPFKKNNVFKLFPEHKQAVNDFLMKNPVDFGVKDDLVQFTQFLSEVP